MEKKEITLIHVGGGCVFFKIDAVHRNHKLLFRFKEDPRSMKRHLPFVSRLLGVHPVVMNIFWQGFIVNGAVSLYGVIKPITPSPRLPAMFDFATTVQLDGDIVCKIDRSNLINSNLQELIDGYAHVRNQFIQKLHLVARRLRLKAVILISEVGFAAMVGWQFRGVLQSLFG